MRRLLITASTVVSTRRAELFRHTSHEHPPRRVDTTVIALWLGHADVRSTNALAGWSPICAEPAPKTLGHRQ
jgi:hypothetical protein